ncbi:hypothetical protein ABW20_dc0100507 [Dactylellina cionopaga]|nr:hypothetical protein ABW20_dc0100507 [Dactylellina cionopaga]
MKAAPLNLRNSAVLAQVLITALIGSANGLIIKARHYDNTRGFTNVYDLNLCRPRNSNQPVLLQQTCDGSNSMPGWRARFEDSGQWNPPHSVFELFGPPFAQGDTNGAYEEPRSFAVQGGSLFYNSESFKPLTFRTSWSQATGDIWRLPFEIRRNIYGQPRTINANNPPAVGDILDTFNNIQDHRSTLLEYPRLLSCVTTVGRIIRRASIIGRDASGSLVTRKYHDADCVDIDVFISDIGYVDPQNPVQPPTTGQLDTIVEQSREESTSPESGSTTEIDITSSSDSSSSAGGDVSTGSGTDYYTVDGTSFSEGGYETALDGSISSMKDSVITGLESDSVDDPEWQQLVNNLEQEFGFSGEPVDQSIDMASAKIDQVIEEFLAVGPDNFDEEAFRQSLESVSIDELDDEIARLEALLAEEA